MNRIFWLAMISALTAVGAVIFLFMFLRSDREFAGTELNNPVQVAGLELTNQRGERLDLAADFSGDVTLVFFGYTRCPDVCPLTMSRLAKAYEELGEPGDLKVAMVTVDPGYDTPEVLTSYVETFHPSFLGLTGSNSEVAEAAKTFFVGFAGSAPELAHTDTVAVLDREGNMRFLYGQDAVIRIGDDLPHLLRLL